MLALTGLLVLRAVSAAAFVNFESGPVRPIALSPDGTLLFATNTPAGLLSVFALGDAAPQLVAEVPVGLEPVAVAVRDHASGHVEAWVVNHLSDSVSVVDVDPADASAARVVRTLWVGDEPRDVVFAGAGRTRAFVSTARRGQNGVVPALLTTPGVGRGLVWAFDADGVRAGTALAPLSVVELFCDGVRALAVSPDGSRVHAAAFLSGNGTTSLSDAVVAAGLGMPPLPDGATPGAPSTNLIVRYDPSTGRWEDELARDWSAAVTFSLPDRDVFEIDADASPPALTGTAVSGVGTVLFNAAVRPDGSAVYVSNLEMRNEVRFEPVLSDDFVRNRVTVIRNGIAQPFDLNPHVDRSGPGTDAERAQSLATPLELAFSPDGALLYVTAFGSGRIAAIPADALETGLVQPHVLEVGGGPAGLVVDAARDRLYVLARFDQRIVTVAGASEPATWAVAGSVGVGYDPTPEDVSAGRRFLYDATNSAHGDASCSSCHVFGNFDGLAWDLGDPFGPVRPDPNPFRAPEGFGGFGFHPLKGPMMTQTLRGMAGAGPMHWRGDRTAAADGGSPFDEAGAFAKFNPAFASLLGGTPLPPGDLQAVTAFALGIAFPPSPVRALDDSLTAQQAEGRRFFLFEESDNGPCVNCHRGPLGTDGMMSFDGPPQDFKIAHLRNAWDRIGMFDGGEQVRGFGFHHNGGAPTLDAFLQPAGFRLGDPVERRAVEAFVLAFDTGLKPAVGQQVTIGPGAGTVETGRLALLEDRSDAGDCDLVVKRTDDGVTHGWLYVGGGRFQSDERMRVDDAQRLLADAALPAGETTFTCVPPGEGARIGIDRDGDASLDADERTSASDPSDPASTAVGPTKIAIAHKRVLLVDGDAKKHQRFRFVANVKQPSSGSIVPPASGAPGDPTLADGGGAVVTVYDASGGRGETRLALDPAGWSRVGDGYRFRSRDPDAAIARAKLAAGRLELTSGPGWKFALGEQAPARIATRVALAGIEWCAVATNKATAKARFVSAPSATPSVCPAPPRGP